jgi:AraC family transcriptional regulator
MALPVLNTFPKPTPSGINQRLVDPVRLVLAGDLARRWSLDVGAEMRSSPVYLTQVFQQVEGLPLLRLARALDFLAQSDDLTSLGLDLGFSSHSQFSAAFRAEFRHSAVSRQISRANRQIF